VGLPIEARLSDLPRNVTQQDGPSTGKEKTIHEGTFYFKDTGGGVVSCNDGAEEPIFESGNKGYGAPLALFTGLKRIPVDTDFAADVALNVINADAMPCTVLAMSPTLDVEENS
jgi:hypothetical protein